MHRRTFIALLASTVVASPRAAAAQQAGKVYRVGLVMGDTPVFTAARSAFVDELQKQRFVEGQNFILDFRSNREGSPALLALMRDLVTSKVDVIVAGGTELTLRAATAVSGSIPIVMWANNFDPIAGGYVSSLAKPGGNITGVFTRQPELAEKQVELLKESFPQNKRLAVLWDAQSADQFEAAGRRARLLGLELISQKLDKLPYDIPAAFRSVQGNSPQMLLVASGPNIGGYAQSIVDQQIQYRLPAMHIFKTYVERGGLMSYGVNIPSSFRQLAAIVARVLNGSRPADLPIELPTLYDLAVNLKTAKAIGVELPTSILLRANSVIE